MTFEDGCNALVRAGQDLTVRQLAVLHHAARRPGQSTGQLAAALHMSKPAVCRAVARLVLDKLVGSVRAIEDRRKVCISATTAGVQLLATVGTVLK